MRLRHEEWFSNGFFAVENEIDNQQKMSHTESQHQITTTSSERDDFNVIETLRQYNQSQVNKIICIENDTAPLNHDVDETTDENELLQQSQPAGNTKSV